MYIIVDDSNNGIIAFALQYPIAKHLNQGFLNTNVKRLRGEDLPIYTPEYFYKNHLMIVDERLQIVPMKLDNVDTNFLNQKNWAKIRLSGYYIWMKYFRTRSIYLEASFDITTLIAENLKTSNHKEQSEFFHLYGEIADISPVEAYEILKLEYDAYVEQKIYFHATFKKFANRLNKCFTQEEINLVCAEMKHEFD